MSIYEKLSKVQGLAVAKDAENPFYKSKYMSLDNIISVLADVLKDNDWLVYHYTEAKEVCTVLYDIETKEQIVSRFPLVETNDPQKYGSCITYAKRYNLGQIFNIITDEDDDGNAFNEKPKAATQSVGHNASIKCQGCQKDLYESKQVKTAHGIGTVFSCDVCKNDKGYPLGTWLKTAK